MQVPPKEKGSGVEKAGGVLQNIQMQRFVYVQNDILRKKFAAHMQDVAEQAKSVDRGELP
jgi:hypothetical protein